MDRKTAREVLVRARAATKSQGRKGDNSSNNPCMLRSCGLVIGEMGIWDSFVMFTDTVAYSALVYGVSTRETRRMVSKFNDDPEVTFEDVLAAFDRAIAYIDALEEVEA